jgi:hypothetical protein
MLVNLYRVLLQLILLSDINFSVKYYLSVIYRLLTTNIYLQLAVSANQINILVYAIIILMLPHYALQLITLLIVLEVRFYQLLLKNNYLLII